MTENKEADPVEQAIDSLKPLVGRIGFGGFMGYCSGLATKKIGQAVATVIGIGFVALQALAYNGYIKIDWDNVKVSLVKQIDSTGDGKFDTEDMKTYWRKAKTMLTTNLPGAGGFSLGFMLGVKHG